MDTKSLAELATVNLAELAKVAPDLTISVKLGDLCKFHSIVLSDTKRELEETVISEKEERFVPRKEACEILGIDEVTAWRWDKKKYWSPIRIGGMVRYRMSEIRAILNGGKKALQNQ